ncbi:TonB-dependent receptor [Thalassotalea ponticola]|uniref:TonB-dependent receptor n=1 Tax=Thalassotalea ponticola TaxID=1523392 RepID=UPI0025B5EEFA|nr:TonB-dependent receptor [Thalassotalea ponticola]MDN3653185.1 TonB-dependent receptor [Thalassotalea ponticola]
MYSNNKLAKAVRLALVFGASATAGISANAFAAEEATAEEDVERIEVTGSRIKRTDLEGASPVTVMTAEDIKVEGNFTVADALRGSSFNSFGSFSERSGSSAQSQATINLRGAGSARTLVLLDGKRLPGSPTLGGQSANLNAIPMAAVERIEILTNGASSTYGSDAMAGVVNIILKKNYEGLEFTVGAGQRDQDEGTTSNEFSIIGGYSNDKGNVTFSFDHQRRQGISDGARPYTAAKTNDLNGDGVIDIYTGEADGWSWYGASVFAPDFSEVQASPLCDDLIAEYGSDVFMKMNAKPGTGYDGEVCAFAYANVSYNTASVDRNTLFVDANYELTDGIEWFGRAMFVQNESFGRYAPPAAPWANISADNPHNPYGVDGAYGLFRWVGIGNRDGIVDDYNQDYLTGLTGELDWNNASWEVYYHRNIADNKSVGRFYLSYGGLAYNEKNDIPLGSEVGTANMKSTTLQDSSSTFDQYFAGIGFDLFALPGGDIAHYFGTEYMEQTYSDLYDGQSEAGLIGGSAGNSAAGERDIKAFFYEAQMPIIDSVELNIAARYDDYSDFGDNVAPMAAVRWEPLDGLVVRASYSESFRAPGLDELNAATTFSAEAATDFRQCEQQGTSPEDCPERQFDTYYKSNPNLGAEESEYTNIGVAWDITDDIGVKVDYFDLSITNAIQTKTVQGLLTDEDQGDLVALEQGADTTNETFYLIRSPGGGLLEAGTGYYNSEGSLNIEGVDVTLSGAFETAFGDFRLNMINSFVLDWGDEFNYAGTDGAPDHKAVATVGWSMDAFSFAWTTNYTASTSESSRVVDNKLEESGKLDSWILHHVTASYDAGSYGTITFQVNNLTDEDPVLNSLGQWTDQNLYNNFGRDYRVSYNIKF